MSTYLENTSNADAVIDERDVNVKVVDGKAQISEGVVGTAQAAEEKKHEN